MKIFVKMIINYLYNLIKINFKLYLYISYNKYESLKIDIAIDLLKLILN